MTAEVDGHEVSFPLWVKVVGWIIGLLFPVMILMGGWMASSMIGMRLELAALATQVELSADDRYRGSQATDAHRLLQLEIDQILEDLRELQRLHGRG